MINIKIVQEEVLVNQDNGDNISSMTFSEEFIPSYGGKQ